MMRQEVSAQVVSSAVHSPTDWAHSPSLVKLTMVDQGARVLERLAAQLAAVVLAAF